MSVQYTDVHGVVLRSAEAEYMPLDHLPGGYLLVPAAPVGAVDFVVPSLANAAQLQVARPAELRRLRLPHEAPLLHKQAQAR